MTLIKNQLHLLDLYNDYKKNYENRSLEGFFYFIKDETGFRYTYNLFKLYGHYSKYETVVKIIKSDFSKVELKETKKRSCFAFERIVKTFTEMENDEM